MKPPRRTKLKQRTLPRRVLTERFQLIVDCRDEADQRRLFEWLAAKGYSPRVWVL